MSKEGFKPGRIKCLDNCFQERLERVLNMIEMPLGAR